ncbi:MAG: PDZ domain-containing protein [Candidatus Zixiibacteriota bacterium]|nr:MAG: PDZ domain-containing protein [candidate division Zixibacteria bacterium]
MSHIQTPTKFQRAGYALAVLGLLALAGWALPAQAQDDNPRGYLGVYLEDLDQQMRETLNYDQSGGVLVDDVVRGGPADRAGLQHGDVIVQFKGERINDQNRLRELIGQTNPGDRVDLQVFRAGNMERYTVELGDPAQAPRLGQMDRSRRQQRMMVHQTDPNRAWLGVEVMRLSGQLADYFKVEDDQGVLVNSVVDNSPAAKAEIRAGDVIIQVDGEDINSRRSIVQALEDRNPGDEVTVNVIRDGKKKDLKVQLSEVPEEYRAQRPMMEGFGMGDGGEAPRDMRGMDSREAMRFHMMSAEEFQDLQRQVEDLQRQVEELRNQIQQNQQ